MIQGTYVKDGNITQFAGNGMEEIRPEIQVIPMVSMKKRLRRKVDSFTLAQAIFSGIAWGMPLGIMICTALATYGTFRLASIASAAVFCFWVIQNYFVKR